MRKYRIGNHSFLAEDLPAAIEKVKQKGWSGKLECISKTVEEAVTALAGDDREVTATCIHWSETDGKMVRNTHRWTAMLSEVAGQKCCPDHR